MKLHRLVVPHREYPISPSPQATQGALAIYADGQRKDDAEQMLFGLSVLRSVSDKQLHEALVTFAQRHPGDDRRGSRAVGVGALVASET